MPHSSGPAALAILRERGLDIPYICVSGTITEELAVAAMKAGANDYVTKGQLKRLLPAIERELREAQGRATLRATEASFATLVEYAPVGIYRSTPEGRFLSVNAAVVRMLGYDSAADVLALDMARDVYADAAERQRLVLRDSYRDRKSTRLNSSHGYISYAVFCLKKKKTTANHAQRSLATPYWMFASVSRPWTSALMTLRAPASATIRALISLRSGRSRLPLVSSQ